MLDAARWPCGVCSRGVGSNSIQCTSCQKWVHKQHCGKKGSMYKVIIYLQRLLESCNQYRMHKCRYWCQCKSGVT